MIVKMECPHSQESLSELAEILKRDVIERLCAELECLPQKTGWVNDSLN